MKIVVSTRVSGSETAFTGQVVVQRWPYFQIQVPRETVSYMYLNKYLKIRLLLHDYRASEKTLSHFRLLG